MSEVPITLVVLAVIIICVLLLSYIGVMCGFIRERWDSCGHGMAFFFISWLIVTSISYGYILAKVLDTAKEILQ